MTLAAGAPAAGVGPSPPPAEAMRWRRRLALGATALAFGAIGPIMVAIALARPWLVGLAAVPLAALVSEIAAARPPRLLIDAEVSARRVTEGDDVTVSIGIESDEAGVLLLAPMSTGGVRGGDASSAIDLVAGVRDELTLSYRAFRWGRGGVGLDRVEWRTPLGLITWHARVERLETVWVHPAPLLLRSHLGVAATTARSGPHRARVRGQGVEFHSLRTYEPGDRWRDLDHRRLARSGEAWTRTRHAERSRDLMVVVDLLDDSADATGPDLTDRSLRAAEAVVSRHLADRDRVGVLVLGRRPVYVAPRDGRNQGHLILDRLMRAEGREPARLQMRRVDLRRRVPARATVFVVSPLFDDEIVDQIHALRRHGRDVAVIHVAHDLVALRREELSSNDRLAADLHRLRAEAISARLRAERIALVPWGARDDARAAIESVQQLHTALTRRAR